MQFFIALLGLVGLASANIRLPLPLEIIQLHPELMHEPLHPEGRIVYGKPVQPGEVKYQIGLIKDGNFICGGSIIDANTILTAAHCVFRSEGSPQRFKIRHSTLDRTDSSNDATVAKIVSHPQYNSNTIDFDVAIIKLAKSILPSENAEASVLDTALPTDSDDLLLTGWGRNENSALPGMLQKAESLKFITKEECQKKWGTVNAITDRMLCVVSTSQSACNGDSGGPLKNKSTGKQVGVVSWGANGCKVNSYPNVFASVENLKKWIDDTSKENN